MYKSNLFPMPDVANQKVAHQNQSINWVGMGDIYLPLTFVEGAVHQQVIANSEVFVNLVNGSVRGIHMSRLYLLTDDMSGCSKEEVIKLLGDFVATHKEMSTAAMLRLRFQLMLKRKALVSDNVGWRAYPVEIEACTENGKLNMSMAVGIDYSSTCPCSKALAEQVICNKFDEDMGSQENLTREQVQNWLQANAVAASPHSQRSHARVEVTVSESGEWGVVTLINLIEGCLQTAVQSAVKREDEQRFAILNSQNPMFCEDAARLIKNTLIGNYPVFSIRVDHFESLHAHNAVAICSYP